MPAVIDLPPDVVLTLVLLIGPGVVCRVLDLEGVAIASRVAAYLLGLPSVVFACEFFAGLS